MISRQDGLHNDEYTDFVFDHRIDVLSGLQHVRHLSSQLPTARLADNLDDLVVDDSCIQIATNITLDPSAYALFFMQMQAKGAVQRVCQRCLEPVSNTINITLNWQVMRAVIPNMQIEPGYEVMAEAEYSGIVALFLQEITLSLPDIALHRDKKCLPKLVPLVDNSAPGVESEQYHNNNQFAALAMLTKRQTSGEN